MKIKRGDKVEITVGKDKGKQGKVLVADLKAKRVIVEGVAMVKKHQKAKGTKEKAGIVSKEAFIDVSNVMFLHKGKPTRIGYKLETIEKDGKQTIVKHRIAKSTGEVID